MSNIVYKLLVALTAIFLIVSIVALGLALSYGIGYLAGLLLVWLGAPVEPPVVGAITAIVMLLRTTWSS